MESSKSGTPLFLGSSSCAVVIVLGIGAGTHTSKEDDLAGVASERRRFCTELEELEMLRRLFLLLLGGDMTTSSLGFMTATDIIYSIEREALQMRDCSTNLPSVVYA